MPSECKYLHASDGIILLGRETKQVRVLHVLRHPLQEAQRLVEPDRHGDLA